MTHETRDRRCKTGYGYGRLEKVQGERSEVGDEIQEVLDLK